MAAHLTRRQALCAMGLASVGMTLAACQATVVDRTVIVEKPVEKVIEKVIVQTVVVPGTPQVVEKIVTQTAAPAPPVTIRCIVSPNPSDGRDYWDAAAALYQETYPGRTVEMSLPGNWAGQGQAIALALASGEPLDGFCCQEGEASRYWEQGAASPLEELRDADERWTLEKWSPVCHMQISRRYTYNEHLIAIPQYAAPMVWLYNKAKMQEYELEMPDTWEQLRRIGGELQSRGHAHPFYISAPGGWAGHGQLWGFGAAGVTNEAGDQQLLDSAEVLAAVENWWRLYHVDKLCDMAWETGQPPDPIAEAIKGDLLAWEEGPWALRGRYQGNAALYPTLGACLPPTGPQGHISNVLGSCSMCSSRGRHQAEAWDFFITANDEDLLADEWLIPYLDTAPPIGAYQKPWVADKAPLMADMLEIMNSQGRVVWPVPWYWDVVAIHDRMLKEMIRIDNWPDARAMVKDFAAQAQVAVEEGIYGNLPQVDAPWVSPAGG